MSKISSKSLSDFIPQPKQPQLPTFRSVALQQTTSSIMRITEPSSAALTTGSRSQFNIQTSQTPSLTSSRRVDSNNAKRLKLKDYLHLNSIEKKSKKSSSTSKNELQQTTTLTDIRKNPLFFSNTQQPITLIQSTILSEPQSSTQSLHSSQILKQDIKKRIEAQINELNDLANYVKNDFKVHENESDSQLLLFNVLNSVVNASKNYHQIGDQIIQYEKAEGGSSSREGNQQYYWHRNCKQLESPAKILKKGLEMTFNLANFLHGKK